MDLKADIKAEHLSSYQNNNDYIQSLSSPPVQLSIRKNLPKFNLTKRETRDIDTLLSSWDCLKDREAPTSEYFNTLPNLNSQMRYQLVEWYIMYLIGRMCDSSCDLHFQRQTFHLAVSYVDAYLSNVPVMDERDLQFLGAGALLLASKMEENGLPSTEAFVQFDWELDEEDITSEDEEPLHIRQLKSQTKLIGWEDKILAALDWKLRPATR
jgi:hypothetical protein